MSRARKASKAPSSGAPAVEARPSIHDPGVIEILDREVRCQVRGVHCCLDHHDREDLQQELVVHVLAQLRHFDVSRGKLTTFIARIVRNKLASLITRSPMRRNGHGSTVSLHDEVSGEIGEGTFERWNTLASDGDRRLHTGAGLNETERNEIRLDMALVKSWLPPGWRSCCELRATYTATEIAALYGTRRNSVHKALRAVRRHLKAHGLTGYLNHKPVSGGSR